MLPPPPCFGVRATRRPSLPKNLAAFPAGIVGTETSSKAAEAKPPALPEAPVKCAQEKECTQIYWVFCDASHHDTLVYRIRLSQWQGCWCTRYRCTAMSPTDAAHLLTCTAGRKAQIGN